MERLVSFDFYNIISQITDQDFNQEHIFDVFKREMPKVAPKYGIVLLKSVTYEPIKRSRDVKVIEDTVFDGTNGEETNNIEFEYQAGNGARVVITTGIRKDDVWTEELKEDNYVISRIIFLLAGRARSMALLTDLMFNDQMTGIANETCLSKYMGMTISQGRFHCYYTNFINIKDMKVINSRYGEPAGDAVMIGFAKALSSFTERKNNGIVARLGGDNFFAFIAKEDEDEFIECVKRVSIPYTNTNGVSIDIKVDARVGYCSLKPGDGINEAMRNADIASKLARRPNYPDYVLFEESMKSDILRIRQLEQNIPAAIDNKEFVVYYQPQADISKEGEYKLSGAEALVRWQKDGVLVPPGEFIPVLEKNGLISLIDYYVFEQVCIDINNWIERGMEPVKVSSNFSRRHLMDIEFADKVEAIIKKHNVDTKYLEIEITESYDDEDMQAIKNFEKRMHAIGVDLALDDFGNGFSSIKLVKNIVADTIKLDKSIIDGIGEGGAEDIIISNIINMLNCLGKNIIAEGVETEKQAAFLRESDCKNIQGFLFARPCPKDEFEKYMK